MSSTQIETNYNACALVCNNITEILLTVSFIVRYQSDGFLRMLTTVHSFKPFFKVFKDLHHANGNRGGMDRKYGLCFN